MVKKRVEYIVKKTFSEINRDGKKENNFEKYISLSVENKIDNLYAKDYLAIIYYHFLKGNILPEKTFSLIYYLKYKRAEWFDEDNKNLIKQGIKILPNVDNPLNALKTVFALYRNINEQNENLPSFDELVDSQSHPNEYEKFKENYWRLVLMEYNKLGEEKFNRQYEMNIIAKNTLT